jgi:hypothetical protein
MTDANARRSGRLRPFGMGLALLVLMALLICGSLAPSSATGRARDSTPQNLYFSGGAIRELGSKCSGSGLPVLAIHPGNVNVSPLQDQVFWATVSNGCGSSTGEATVFSWWLTPTYLGVLNSTAGAAVAYSACLAPMSGTLHVTATTGGQTLYANSSVAVTLQNPGWENTGADASNGSGSVAGNSRLTPVTQEAAVIGVSLLVLVGVVALIYARKGRP